MFYLYAIQNPPRAIRAVVLIGLTIVMVLPILCLLKPILSGRLQVEEAVLTAQEFLDSLEKGDLNRAKDRFLIQSGSEPLLDVQLNMVLQMPFVYEVDRDHVSGEDRRAAVSFVARYDEKSLLKKSPVPGLNEALASQMAKTLELTSRQLDGKRGELQMKRTEIGWRVAKFHLGNLEFGSMGRDEKRIQVQKRSPAFDAIQTMPIEKFDSAWNAVRGGRQVEAGKLLREMVQNQPSFVFDRSVHVEDLHQPVLLRPGTMTRLEAIDAAAATAGLRMELSNGTTIIRQSAADNIAPYDRQTKGDLLRSAGTIAHAGPFRIQATHIKTFSPLPTGQIRLTVVSIDLPSGVTALLANDHSEWFEVQVADEQGQSLISASRSRFHKANMQRSLVLSERGQAIAFETIVPIHNLYRGVERIAVIRGTIRVQVPDRVELIEFRDLKLGDRRPIGSGFLEVTTFSHQLPNSQIAKNETAVAFTARGEVRDELLVHFTGADGELSYASRLIPGETIKVPGTVASAAVKVVRAITKSYSFELHDIPLPLPPLQPTVLTFPKQPGPVQLTDVGIGPADIFGGLTLDVKGPPAINVKAVNHANKAIEWIRIAVAVQDAGGKVVQEFEQILPTNLKLDAEPQSLINPGKSVKLPPIGSGIPNSARSASASVREIGFMDGTTWKP